MKRLAIKEIEKLLDYETNIEMGFIEELRLDERKGVQQLLRKYDKKREHVAALEAMHDSMCEHERQLRTTGYRAIAGLDEVGRGPLAGPVVAAAVVLPPQFQLLGLTDSKKLSKEKRELFYKEIKKQATAYSIATVDARTIDEINIYQATKLAMTKAVKGLGIDVDYLLLDAINLSLPIKQLSLIKGDQKSLSIAASSVLAKVTRDRYMEELDQKYPEYGFSKHVGYGTKEHLEAINQYGITPEHRRSFRPIKEGC
ncbi:ribonuclease HII [Halalkalibacter urbisdiaboli]|uniref:ribonuclease HII n=1 Tax=Halalkalibacter urbisdiaboli TaxID=1960589 RepID=UPI000B44E455|nr:ribonuclease HII [Halalkalibacter urbisdiaboli]